MSTATMPLPTGTRLVKDVVFVCSIHPHKLHFYFSFGGRGIRPCLAGHPYQVTIVEGGLNKYDYGDKNQHTVPVPAEEIAASMCQASVRDLGVGVIEGPVPTDAELAEIRRIHLEYCQKVVKQADVDWSRHKGKHEHIPDVARRAAKTLGITRDWLTVIVPTSECLGCGNNVNDRAAFCSICGTVVNEEAYAQLLAREARAKAQAEAYGVEPPASKIPGRVGADVKKPMSGAAKRALKKNREAPPVGDED
jgi:hypothetical protein